MKTKLSNETLKAVSGGVAVLGLGVGVAANVGVGVSAGKSGKGHC